MQSRFVVLLTLLLIFPLVGCGTKTKDEATILQLNWFPESEHGGAYQALSDGTYERSGLKVKIQPGGQGTRVGPELTLGRCQFAFANADDVVFARNSGLDVVAVLAALQKHPRCIMTHPDSGATSFEKLKGLTLQREEGRAFVMFMEKQGILDGVQQVPYHGGITALIADPKVATQAYIFAEPLLARQQGVEVNTLLVSDLGFNPYSSVLVTSGELIRENPDLVEKFVRATQKGWHNYFDDPSKGNQAILAANEHGMTAEALEFGSREMKPLAMPDGAPIESVGTMTQQRWETLVKQMAELELIDPEKVDASECFSAAFLLPAPDANTEAAVSVEQETSVEQDSGLPQ